MGNILKKKKKRKCVIFGLNGSGKTSIMYKLLTGEYMQLPTTTSFNHEVWNYKDMTFDVYDIGWIFHKHDLYQPNNYHYFKPEAIGCYINKDGVKEQCHFNGVGLNKLSFSESTITELNINCNFTMSIQDIYNKYDTKHLLENTDAIIIVIDSDDPYSFNHDAQYKDKIKANMDTDPYVKDIVFVELYLQNIMKVFNMNMPQGISIIIAKYYLSRIEISVKELQDKLLSMEGFVESPLLVWANKQDLPCTASINQICEDIGMNTLRNRQWYLQSCCALTGEGLYEGLDWLSHVLTKKK